VKYISIPMELSQREVHQMINSDSTEEPEPSLHSSASPTSSSKRQLQEKATQEPDIEELIQLVHSRLETTLGENDRWDDHKLLATYRWSQ
jgi:hypothetical protein